MIFKNPLSNNDTHNAEPQRVRHRAEAVASKIPKLLMHAQKAANTIVIGEHNLRRSGSGERFWQFRHYDPSDRPQDIDWRQTAKTDNVYVKQKEMQRSQTFLFWSKTASSMDWVGEYGPKRQTKMDTSQIITLALAIIAKRSGELIRHIEKPGQGGRTDQVLHEIALGVSGEPEQFGKQLVNINNLSCPQNSMAILSGDFIEPFEDIEHSVKSLSTIVRKGTIIQILDPNEVELPYTGRVDFQSPMDMHIDHQNIDNVRDIRTTYEERIRLHQKHIKDLCRATGWLYFFHRTDWPITPTISKIWQYLIDENSMNRSEFDPSQHASQKGYSE